MRRWYGRRPMEMPSTLEAAHLVRRGHLSAAELLELCFEAIEERNGELNAFVHLDVEGARAQADAVDRELAAGRADALGPLAGVPFGVKDLEDCAGMPTTRGSRWFAGRPPVERDAIHVARLRAAGAIPIGKTAAPELGTWAYTASPALGVTRNPWDPAKTPGGSSGGSSAAVSAGMVADTALLLDVMAGPDDRDRTCLPPPGLGYLDVIGRPERVEGLRAAWSSDLGFAVVEPEVAALTRAAAGDLVEAAGLTLVERAVDLDDHITTYARMEGVDQFVGIAPDAPAGLTGAGLPIGLQVVARRFREDVCLALAAVQEQARPWPRHVPAR